MSKYDCPRPCVARHARCHIECPQYAKRREQDEQQRLERHMETAVKVYQIEQKNKAIQAKQNHKKWKEEKR